MKFSLTSDLEKFVKDRAESGDYNNASEVAGEALRLLKKREKLEELKLQNLRLAIQGADQNLKNGDFVDFGTTKNLERFFGDL